MPGRRGLGHTENAHKVTDAQFLSSKQVENAEPCPVRDGSKHQVNGRLGHLNYIRLSDYNAKPQRCPSEPVCPRVRPRAPAAGAQLEIRAAL